LGPRPRVHAAVRLLSQECSISLHKKEWPFDWSVVCMSQISEVCRATRKDNPDWPNVLTAVSLEPFMKNLKAKERWWIRPSEGEEGASDSFFSSSGELTKNWIVQSLQMLWTLTRGIRIPLLVGRSASVILKGLRVTRSIWRALEAPLDFRKSQ